MKRKYLIRFSAAVAALGLLTFLAWSFLEIHPRRRWIPPSREARANEYLALDRWLQAMGHPVRVVRSGSLSTISGAEERRVFVQASLFTWAPGAAPQLIRWIEEGGSLFLVLDYQAEWEFWNNAPLLLLLEEFGIEAAKGSRVRWHRDGSGVPSFGQEFSFEVSQDEDESILALEDWAGITRLVQVQHGMGRLIVSGRPRFLFSQFLDSEPNTRLAWALFAADAAHGNENGWLFIRGPTRAQGLLGSLFTHGNLWALGVSALVFLAIGFWAVVPMFGLVRRDDERPGKPLRERFIAEGRFFKTYDALGFYRDVYIKEIRRRLAKKEGISADDEIIEHILNTVSKTGKEKEGQMLISAIRKEPIKYREFPKMISIFKTILERI